jgi:uncharacterized protein YggE
MRRVVRFLLFFFTGMYSAGMLAQCNQNCPERRTITVTATGTAIGDADLAIVRVGYKLYGMDARSAYATASDTSNAIMQALTGSGVPKSAIESSSQVLQHTPPYELQQIPMGSEDRMRRQFTVAQSWTIRVKPDEASKSLNTAINAGANESGWIEWTVENPSALEAQASAKALANARLIAEQTVQKSDVHLGHLVSATENQSPMMNRPINGAIGGIMGGIGMGQGVGSTPPLAINSRRVEYDISMYAVFAVE